MSNERVPMFKIAANVFDAFSVEDITKTAKDMEELGIYKPPYAKLHLQLKTHLMEKVARCDISKDFSFWAGVESDVPPKSELRFFYTFTGNGNECIVHPYLSMDGREFVEFSTRKVKQYSSKSFFEWMCNFSLAMLIVLLATKNVEKDVEVCNKPHSRKTREKRLSQYSSVTTIKIGKITETVRSAGGSGSSVRPHLRRGHIRSQHYGVNNSEVKKIFIHPIFVNADDGWIDAKKTYRVVS